MATENNFQKSIGDLLGFMQFVKEGTEVITDDDIAKILHNLISDLMTDIQKQQEIHICNLNSEIMSLREHCQELEKESKEKCDYKNESFKTAASILVDHNKEKDEVIATMKEIIADLRNEYQKECGQVRRLEQDKCRLGESLQERQRQFVISEKKIKTTTKEYENIIQKKDKTIDNLLKYKSKFEEKSSEYSNLHHNFGILMRDYDISKKNFEFIELKYKAQNEETQLLKEDNQALRKFQDNFDIKISAKNEELCKLKDKFSSVDNSEINSELETAKEINRELSNELMEKNHKLLELEAHLTKSIEETKKLDDKLKLIEQKAKDRINAKLQQAMVDEGLSFDKGNVLFK